MKPFHFLERKRFRFGHWRLANHGRLSVLLLLFFVLHAVALITLKVTPPPEAKLNALKNPVIQIYMGDEQRSEDQAIAFQLRYQDPSSVSRSLSKNLSSLPREIPLKIGLESEPLSKVVISSDFLTELESPKLAEKAANFLPIFLPLPYVSTVTNQLLRPSSSMVVIGQDVVARLVSDLPNLSAQVTDQPLVPTVIRVEISPNGIVESALIEVSSGNLNLDKEAVQMSLKLRFSPDFEKASVWSTFTYYWLQTSTTE